MRNPFLTDIDYLGFERLVIYADLISKDLALETKRIEPNTRSFVTLQVASSAFSIVFSIRELVKLGYFTSARILLRSLLDRTATIAWIRANSDYGIQVWENGWRYKERPERLDEKLSCLHQFKIFVDDNRPLASYLKDEGFIGEFHGDVHGDLASSKRNIVISSDGEQLYAAGPILHDHPLFVRTCKLASAITGQFMKELEVSLSNDFSLWKLRT